MHHIPVSEIMQHTVITIHPEALASDAATLMEEMTIRRLPVLDENEWLVGIVTDTDVLEAETAHRVLNSYEPDTEAQWLAVADIMTRDVVTITADATVGQLALKLLELAELAYIETNLASVQLHVDHYQLMRVYSQLDPGLLLRLASTNLGLPFDSCAASDLSPKC